MPFQRPPGPLSVLASALTACLILVVAGCSNVTPLGPEPSPVSLPPARQLGSPISVQVMRSQPPTPTGGCPAGSSRALRVGAQRAAGHGGYVPPRAGGHREQGRPGPAASRPTPPGPATPSAPPAGVACYRPAGTPVTITSAAVSPVTTNRNQPGPAWYEFVVAFPAADVPALTADVHRAYDSGDAVGMSVAGKLWQAPQLRRKFIALRAEQINLLSRNQAFQLYHLLVPSG